MHELEARFRSAPIVALLGPRQCGKTTLARDFAAQARDHQAEIGYFDLERPADLARLDNPETALRDQKGLVVIDEIQRRPDLFPVLRYLIDRPTNRMRLLILGSASRHLLQQTSETLAGRISFLELTPFQLGEVGGGEWRKLWLRGGYPRSLLAATDEVSAQWREDYISTYLERDLPSLGFQLPAPQLRRFWLMLAHLHGQNFHATELGGALGVTYQTTRRYLDILTGTFMMRQLHPWFENLGKRQVKAPKVYFRDSGLLHSLLGLQTQAQLEGNPRLGASWEGFAMEEILRSRKTRPEDAFFWAVHGQSEVDLVLVEGGEKVGFEFKYSDAPRLTKSMVTARDTLGLRALKVVYPGELRYALEDGIEALPLQDAINDTSQTSNPS